ncbi:sensor histidine kinase [Nocardia sp. NPDC057353]|uniref:sensor histidine kinase n=1 Tax=Nocardia sp. NPDC057353 TaxID=3346104 RepID=UPI003635C78C
MRAPGETNRGSVVWDWGLAGGVAVLQLALGYALDLRQVATDPLDALGTALLIAGPVALVLRRYHPLPVLYVVFAVAIAYPLLGHGYLPALAAPAAAFLTAAAVAPWQYTYPVIPVAYLCMVWPLPVLLGREQDGWQALGALGWALALAGTAELLRQRAELVRCAQRLEEAEPWESIAHRERESAAERLALAEELHGVVVHSLSAINKQSGLALELADRKPQQVVVALAAVKTASRAALEDAQELLSSLRRTGVRPEEPAAGGEPLARDEGLLGRTAGFLVRPPKEARRTAEPAEEPVAPKPAPKPDAPSLDDLDGIMQRARSSGVAVTYRVIGTAAPLPAAIDVVGAGIVVESLRNVQRHAPGAEATVTLRYAADSVDITVDNTRPAAPPPRTPGPRGGDGIIAMRERAHELGGALTAGPRPSGGFRVAARLPAQARLAAVPGPKKEES